MTVVAVTGHRPEKITNPEWVRIELLNAYKALTARRVITGMAAGVDLWAAREAFIDGIPFVCARPWAGHGPRKIDTFAYNMATKHADKVVDIDDAEDYPGPWVYQKRNEWMVDNANIVIAVWDGTSGGTANCVKYAKKVGKSIYLINPATAEVVGLGN